MFAIIFILMLIAYFYLIKNTNNTLICLAILLFIIETQTSAEHMSSTEALNTIASSFNNGNINASSMRVTGNLVVDGTISSTNGTTVIGNSLNVNNNMTVTGTSTFTGATTCNGNATFNGNANLNNPVVMSNNLTVNGTSTLGQFAIKNNILSNDQFFIGNKRSGNASRFVFQNDGNILGYRGDNWVSSGLAMQGIDIQCSRSYCASPVSSWTV